MRWCEGWDCGVEGGGGGRGGRMNGRGGRGGGEWMGGVDEGGGGGVEWMRREEEGGEWMGGVDEGGGGGRRRRVVVVSKTDFRTCILWVLVSSIVSRSL